MPDQHPFVPPRAADARHLPPGMEARPAFHRHAALRFLSAFALLVLAGFGAIAGAHWLLARQDLLPPPPLAATDCIDGKFAELRTIDLTSPNLIAIGSSATWRNLDLAAIARRLPGATPYNAAPCYLHIDQTAFLAEQLLPRLPAVTTVLTVVHPRDFEACPAAARAFFEPALFGAYLDGTVPGWLPYVSGFRPLYLARTAAERRAGGQPEGDRVAEDRFGSAVLRHRHFWRPELQLDPSCMQGLADLEAVVAERGARLVVAVLPMMPEWASANDPEGRRVDGWVRDMRARLTRPETLFVDGRTLQWDNSRFADPVHLIYPEHSAFSDLIGAAMQKAGFDLTRRVEGS
ncbi:hypothetical protein ACFOD4_11035 [Pseudoroseomonas globiformis]|uniref:SGNH/GDSL hydrolase family protein n=1 Tax=Teichococcus globiformis TaxID=2307229 RepID=A0ABV7FYX0_9PROT